MSTLVRASQTVGFGPAADLVGAFGRLIATWRERSQGRRALAQLDDALLRDIGVTRAQVEFEAGKPFWQV
ncbi:MAG TPA: DUF1127 domain-containing protein [Alphaproteobacteria bacterium]|nr:DUF1127 domain-containing protein [Alphaproteobacteria bacterium]